jgi:hypothetical protein
MKRRRLTDAQLTRRLVLAYVKAGRFLDAEEVAEAWGVSTSTARKYLNGDGGYKRPPRIATDARQRSVPRTMHYGCSYRWVYAPTRKDLVTELRHHLGYVPKKGGK